MQKRWFWLTVILLISITPLMAQDDTPPAVREAALDAGEAALGVRSTNWRYQALNPTSDSSLGCPLVDGETLPFEITPYRVELIYPDGVYVVFVSADGRTTQLCDSKFGDLMTSPVEAEPDPNACMVTPSAALPAYAAPDNTVAGVFSTTAGTAYAPFGRSSDNLWYQVANDIGIGWVDANQVALSGDCRDVPVTSYTAPDYTGAACFISPAAAFSNVRSQPNVESAQVAQIFENAIFQVTARNTAADWYYIQPGWVAARVTTQIGDCTSVTVNDSIVGTGFAEDLPGDLDESVAQALAEYPCPIDFADYMRPRLSVGFANAQVEIGNTPNTLRSYPNVDDSIGQRLGVIQPGRVIDRIISGPACNQGFVWWLVEIDGQIGWTAESNAASDDYYIEPMNGDQPATTDTTTDTVTVDENTIVLSEDGAITDLVFNGDGSRLFIGSDIAGFGDGRNGLVTVWNMSTNASEGRIDVPTGIIGLDYASEADVLMVAANNNVITFYSASDPNIPVVSTLNNVYDESALRVLDIVISPDGSYFVVLECFDTNCTTTKSRVINTVDGSERFATDFSFDVGWMSSLAISPDGSTLAVAGGAGIAFINMGDGTQSGFYELDGALRMNKIAFNRDGSQIYFVGCKADPCNEGRIDLVDVNSATLLGTAASHGSEASDVTVNPDGTRFATFSLREIILRNAVTGIDIATYDAGGAVTSMTFTPDGSQLVVGILEGQVKFFDATVSE